MSKDKALINSLLNHFSMHQSRIKMMLEIILSLIKMGNVQQRKIAQGINIKAKICSTTRRIQRFFAEQVIPLESVSNLIFSLFDWSDQITLTLDRTNWKFGKIDINFLTICGIYKNCSIPLCWILLPHQGNSSTLYRINLMETLLLIIPINRIHFLLADREFIGAEWFQYLTDKNIRFCIRIKENTQIYNTRHGGKSKLKIFLQYLSVGQTRELKQIIEGVMLHMFCLRMATGELLILAVGQDDNELYRQRWTIETMFKAFKSAGFNFEDTHQKDLNRLSKMMMLLSIAYAWAIRIGEIKNSIEPIKIKIHNRLEFSLFSYGFRTAQTILLKAVILQSLLLLLLSKITQNKSFSDRLAGVTVVY